MLMLFVDDDPDTRALAIRAVLQEFPDARTTEASDLTSLDAVLHDGPPDILITDFDLRQTDGFAVFDRVKRAAPNCTTVMFTGTGNEELAVKAMKHGFDDYVVKRQDQLRRLAASTRVAFDRVQHRLELSENRDLILREHYHRLHNNLQIVISLLRLTEKTLSQAADRQQLADLRGRIQALSAIQETFYRAEDFRHVDLSGFLRDLAQGLLDMTGGRVRLEVDLVPATVPVDVAVPLGLIANELITNALKHAFPDGRGGTLSVLLLLQEERLRLVVSDDGVGFADGLTAAPGGLGLGLVQRLAGQIDGQVRLTRKQVGAECQIEVPLGDEGSALLS